MPFRESRNTNTGKQIWISTKAELFPGESILRFIHQWQHRKLIASWQHYNQSEAVPNIPGKREHDYRRRFTDVSSPDFSRGRGTSVHRLCLNLREHCIFDVISSLNTKFFPIWSSVTGYGEFKCAFSQSESGKYFEWIISMFNLQKHLIRAAFWVLLQAMLMNDWKQTAQRLKLQERLPTINKRNIIPWNICRDNNFHSRKQVLKCL